MSNFEKVLTTLDAAETDINNEHKASEATKRRMETLDKRFTDEDKALKEANKLTQTAENVLKVEVVLNAANLSTLKSNLGDEEFKNFLRNIAHKNEDKRASALRQMETSLGLVSNSLNLSMSDKHSEQLIRTEILDHIAQQLLGGSNLTIAANYIYGSDEALDAKLDDMSNQVIAMLEGFKESDSLKDIDPRTASYNAMFKASDQRYFDDANLASGNKLRGEVMGGFAEKMANDGLSVVTYRDLANQFLANGIDLNAKELVILTGNGMLPFEAPTRSQFKFQYLTYLPELGGYAGVMANGCGDEGKEGNFVFIKDDQSETSKKLTRDGFITEEERKLNEEKKKIEKTITITDEELIKKAEGKGKDFRTMTDEEKDGLKKELIKEKAKESLKLKEDEAKKVKEEEEKKSIDKEVEDKIKEMGDTEWTEKAKEKGLDPNKMSSEDWKKLKEEVKEELKKEKTIEDKEWEITATGTLHYPNGSPTRGVVNFGPGSAGREVNILTTNPENPENPPVSKKFTIRPDGTVEVTNDFYLQQQSESGMMNIVVSNKPIDETNPGKSVNLVPPVIEDLKTIVPGQIPDPKGVGIPEKVEEIPTPHWEPELRRRIQRLFKQDILSYPPYLIDILENSSTDEINKKQKSGLSIPVKDLEDYIVQTAIDNEKTPSSPWYIEQATKNKEDPYAWHNVDSAIVSLRHRILVANRVRTLGYTIDGRKDEYKKIDENGKITKLISQPFSDAAPLLKSKEEQYKFLIGSTMPNKGEKITLTKDVMIDGVLFPDVTFEQTGGMIGVVKIKDNLIKDSKGNEYKAVVANGIVSITKK